MPSYMVYCHFETVCVSKYLNIVIAHTVGSYEAIEGGYVEDALADLTGKFVCVCMIYCGINF